MAKLTHFTFTVNDFDESIAFYRRWFDLVVHNDRRPKGSTVWITTAAQHAKGRPDFVFVLEQGPVRPLDHIGLQVETRAELDDLAARAKEAGIHVKGPVDVGGDIGTYLFVRDPNGHIWEFTAGQPFAGL